MRKRIEDVIKVFLWQNEYFKQVFDSFQHIFVPLKTLYINSPKFNTHGNCFNGKQEGKIETI